MALHYPNDPNVFDSEYQFMYGKDILVAPVVNEGSTSREVYLPEDNWIHLWTGKEYTGSGQFIETDAPLGQPPIFFQKGENIGALLTSISGNNS